MRTLSIVVISRHLLEKPEQTVELTEPKRSNLNWQAISRKTWSRFRKRMKKILVFTVPIYIVIFILNRLQFFASVESFLSSHLDFIPYLSPQAFGIIALHIAAELTAGLAAAGALLQEGVIDYNEAVFALLIGNIISSPLRAVRHQLPYYAGIFKPKLAGELIIYNQCFRIISLITAALFYFVWALS